LKLVHPICELIRISNKSTLKGLLHNNFLERELTTMNYRFIGLIASLALTAGIVSCSATPTTPASQSTPSAKPADAMKSDAMKDSKPADAMKSDAMKDKTGDAMKSDAMKDSKPVDAMKNDAMKGDAMKDGKPADAMKQ
jgi:pentapeptide MXKDX repeat protein